ncbi:hypothetical protein DM860_015827 [Cuscuta australis]|uniref:Ubiquitin-like domain-containing protein n=1 Tax=Cuscuta australis TaxID=267555 RepID=A0A328DZP0_9ASTE|nr:hypothetical protein DM860_015827 [Cuscuta australis]
MGSVDYSEQSKTMCFLSRRSGHKGVVEEVLAAMNSRGVKATSLDALFGKYPKTVPGGKVVCDAIPLTDDRSWNWFLQGALASCNRDLVHLYAVAGLGTGMKIFLNICDRGKSKMRILDVESTNTVGDLMEQIEVLEGISGDKMRLYFDCQVLCPDFTLGYYGVENESALDLFSRQ